jgi:hypothetical protein
MFFFCIFAMQETYMAVQTVFAETVLASSVSGRTEVNTLMSSDVLRAWQAAFAWVSPNMTFGHLDAAWYACFLLAHARFKKKKFCSFHVMSTGTLSSGAIKL